MGKQNILEYFARGLAKCGTPGAVTPIGLTNTAQSDASTVLFNAKVTSVQCHCENHAYSANIRLCAVIALVVNALCGEAAEFYVDRVPMGLEYALCDE